MIGTRALPRALRALAVLSCLGLAGCFGGLMTDLGVGMPKDIAQKGVSAPAEILEIWDTGWTVNDAPVIGMKVRVTPNDAAPFEATIKRTAISRLDVPQFQPGAVIPVRYLKDDPTRIALDRNPPAEETSAAPAGNRSDDGFVRANTAGTQFLPPPAEPRVYLGTSDSAGDALGLFEHEYALVGASRLKGSAAIEDAVAKAKEVGAAVVVLYGHFAPAPGAALDVLPFRPRPQAASGRFDTSSLTIISDIGPDDRYAAFWGKIRPAVLGILTRPLDAREQKRLGRRDGILVESVEGGSPADAAHILAGDVIVAIDGKPLPDPTAVPALLRSLAGRTVSIDLLRDGAPVTVSPRLNPAEP